MHLTQRRAILIFVGLFIVSTILVSYLKISVKFLSSPNSTKTTSPSPIPTITTLANWIKVLYVVDGDTIVVEENKKVRYIGIDTPELHHPTKPVQCFGQEAKAINQKLVEGKQVYLEKDVSETDKYQRLLRYVWVKDNNASSDAKIFVNDYLVRQGYARLATFPPDVKYVDLFRASESQARENNRGLWNSCQ